MNKEYISLSSTGPNRLNIYGGFFDLINGSKCSRQTLEDLKFAALFYKYIIVPDGFFHCYGSLFDHFSRITQKGLVTQESDDTHLRIKRHAFRQVTNGALHPNGVVVNAESGDAGRAARGGHIAREHPHGRALARPIGSEKTHDLALVDAKRDIVHGGN